MPTEAPLDFAYKYPFSSEAKGIVESLNSDKIEERYLLAGTVRVQEALRKGRIEFTEARSNELKLIYIVSYVYARMLVSAVADKTSEPYLVSRYAAAEARRVAGALEKESERGLVNVGKQLGISVLPSGDGSFDVPFYEYVNGMPNFKEYLLIHQKLSRGNVRVERSRLTRILEEAARRQILKNLPIAAKELPKEVIEGSKRIAPPKRQLNIGRGSGKSSEWVEKLLGVPIPDFRHRVVNLILAPYFVNVKKYSEEQAVAAIMDYIQKCKQINPQTKITEQYVKYQCSYAKKRALRPYSLRKAKDLIGDVVDFGSFQNSPESRGDSVGK